MSDSIHLLFTAYSSCWSESQYESIIQRCWTKIVQPSSWWSVLFVGALKKLLLSCRKTSHHPGRKGLLGSVCTYLLCYPLFAPKQPAGMSRWESRGLQGKQQHQVESFWKPGSRFTSMFLMEKRKGKPYSKSRVCRARWAQLHSTA